MKITIIGGGGLVGSSTAFALQCGGVGSEIALVDINQDLARGQALDLIHGTPSTTDQSFCSGDMSHVSDSDIICITAGLRRKPDESRLQLIHRNTELFTSILSEISQVGYRSTAIFVIVSNPVDLFTYVAAQQLDVPLGQVIGLGTQLDTIRFRGLIARELKVAPSQVSAVILGEHGDSMVPIWSAATIAGLPLEQYPGWNPRLAGDLFQRTKGSGAEVIKLKGGAGFAVGIAIRDVIEPIVSDRQLILPISTVQDGSCFGIRDVAISVPTVVARSGVVNRLEMELWPKEVQGLQHSAQVVRRSLQQMGSFSG